MPISEVYNINCLDYMKTIHDKFFDLAIVDPPYGDAGGTTEYDREGRIPGRGRGSKYRVERTRLILHHSGMQNIFECGQLTESRKRKSH